MSHSTVLPKATPSQSLRRLSIPVLTILVVLSVLTLLDDQQRILWWPISLSMVIFSVFFTRFYRPGEPLPLYHLGVVSAGFFLAYTIMPPLWLICTDVTYNPLLNDRQMAFYQPLAQDYVQLVWRYVAFYAAFCLTFAIVCPRDPIPRRPIAQLSPAAFTALLVVAATIMAITFSIQIAYGVDLNPQYSQEMAENFNKIQSLPLLVRQVAGVAARLSIVTKLALAAYGIARWNDKRLRIAIILFTGFFVALSILFPGSRTELFVFLMSVGLAFHHFVRPVQPRAVLIALPLLFAGFLFMGMYRGGGLAVTADLSLAEKLQFARLFFYIPNEFSAIFAGNYDLLMLKANGTMKNVPWTIDAYELLLLIPQQLLPFDKADPQLFYLSKTPVGFGFFMYGPIAQSILGLGWLELFLRGAFVAAIFGAMHHRLLKNSTGFWNNIFYLYMLLFSYTAIRSTTFTFLYFIVFGFIPVYFSVRLTETLLQWLGIKATPG